MTQKQYCEMILPVIEQHSANPPQGLAEHLKAQMKKEILWYKCENAKGGRMALCHCTACGEKFFKRWVPRDKYGERYGGFFTDTIDMENPEDYWEEPDYDSMDDEDAEDEGSLLCEDYEGEDVLVVQDMQLLCPCCHTLVEARHASNMKQEYRFCMTHAVDGENVMFIGWRMVRTDRSESFVQSGTSCRLRSNAGESLRDTQRFCEAKCDRTGTSWSLEPWEAYYFGERDIRARHWNNMGHVCHGKDWRADRGAWMDEWRDCDDLFGFDTHSFDGTRFENAKVFEFLDGEHHGERYALQYMRLYERHSSAENLVMQGFARFVQDYIKGGYKNTANTTFIDWEKVKPHEMLQIPKEHLRIAKECMCNLEHLTAVRKYCACIGKPLRSEEEIALVWDTETSRLDETRENVWAYHLKCLRMIKRHRGNEHTIVDYWRMMNLLGQNMSDTGVLFPPDYEKAHDTAVKMRKERECLPLKGLFKELTKELAALTWEKDGVFIRAAKSEKELSDETAQLGHCVWSYGEAHCNGKPVFFIRHADTPSKSWYTLQLNTITGEVIQNRGKGNCARTEAVEKFERAWLHDMVAPWMQARKDKKQTVKKQAKKKTAKVA